MLYSRPELIKSQTKNNYSFKIKIQKLQDLSYQDGSTSVSVA